MAQSLNALAVGALVKDTGTLYNGKPIIWKIADKGHTGYPSGAVTLITERIISLKCFDAIESGNSDGNRRSYGNNRWTLSNVRQWLNSQAAAGKWYSAQHGADAPPTNANVWSNYNEYDAEAGFLAGFSANFIAALLTTTHTVGKATVDGGGTESCADKIFLATCTEVGLSGDVTAGSKLALFSNDSSRLAYCTNHRYNKQAARTAMIRAAADKNPPVYGFDCVCLIKGVLWGWSGNAAKPYGGAAYASNGVPDLGADTMITKCSGVSADFSGIVPGEAVWLPGHIGVYIGGGKVIECSPAFKNCVQVTACLNIGAISGMNGRKWTKHGKLPYITYDTAGGAQDGAGSTTKPSGTTTTPATLAFAVGDVVRFTGNTHYTNAAAASGAACKPGTAKVTALAKGAKHPYHLIKQPGGGSTVYGWVNAADVQAVGSGTTAPKMRVGAKVKYSGPLYRDSNGGGQGKTVNGTYTVKYYYPARKCGVHIDGLGWVPESGCTVIG